MAEVRIDSLEPNSHKYKEERSKSAEKPKSREKISPVIDRKQVVSTKKPLSKKIIEMFIGDDVKDLKKWLIQDKLIPGLKHMVLDTASMLFFGEVLNRYDEYRGGYRYGKTNYRGYYSNGNSSNRTRSRNSDRNSYRERNDKVDARNIIVRNREDAECIVEEMCGRIRSTGSVSVAEMLDMIDVPGEYTDNNWGWDNERDIGIRRVSNGFLIDVNEPKYLD